MDKVTMLIACAASLAGGGYVGWWLRARRYSVERARLAWDWSHKESNYQSEVQRAEQQLARETTQARAFAQQLERAAAARNELEQRVERAEERTAELATELEARETRLGDYGRTLAKFRAELERAQSMVKSERLASEARALRVAELEPLVERLAERDAALADALAQRAAFELDQEAELARLRAWITELTPLAASLRAREAELEGLHARLASREGALQKVEQRHRAMRDARVKERVELGRLRREGAAQADSKRSLEARLRRRDEEFEALRGTHAELGNELERAREELASLEALASEGEAESKARGARTEAQRAELAATLAEREEELETALVALRETQVRLDAAQTAAAEHARAGDALQAEHERSAESLQTEHAHSIEALLTEHARDAEALRMEHARAVDALNAELAERVASLDAARQHLAALSASHKTLQLKFDAERRREPSPAPVVDTIQRPARAQDTPPIALAVVADEPAVVAEVVAEATVAEAIVTEPTAKEPVAPKKPANKKPGAKQPAPKQPTAKEPAPKKVAPKRAKPAPPDDLTEIAGIGPKLAERLEAEGIRHFSTIAALDAAALEQLAGKLGVPLKRIERDGWVESAKELLRVTA